MIWGCMGWNEVNILSDIEGGMDDESLVIILKAGLLKNIKKSNILKMQLFYSIIITLSRSLIILNSVQLLSILLFNN